MLETMSEAVRKVYLKMVENWSIRLINQLKGRVPFSSRLSIESSIEFALNLKGEDNETRTIINY